MMWRERRYFIEGDWSGQAALMRYHLKQRATGIERESCKDVCRQWEPQVQESWGRSVLGEFEEQRGGIWSKGGKSSGRGR